jgi:hypothetical protein
MKKKKLKISIIVISSILILFGGYNLFWYLSVKSTYDPLAVGFEKAPFSGRILDEKDYSYYIKYPDYLSFTGNLCVSTADDSLTLFIWPGIYSQNEYGVQILNPEDQVIYNIMVDKNGHTDKIYDAPLIEQNKDMIKALFDKANEKWDIYSWE